MRFMAMDSVSCASGLERAQRHAGRDEALADLGDALDLVERHRRAAFGAEVEQVAQRDRRQAAHRLASSACRSGSCRCSTAFCSVWISVPSKACASPRAAQLVEAADRQRRPTSSSQACACSASDRRCDAATGRCRRCARACRGRIPPPARATGRPPRSCSRRDRTTDDRDAHLGHDLQQALVDRLLVVARRHSPSDSSPNRPRRWRSAMLSCAR